jgi:ABC-type phosphate transport system permease subunit
LSAALATAIAAVIIALSLGVGSAAAHHEDGPKDHHDEVVTVHHED